jgi:hypothetical protein
MIPGRDPLEFSVAAVFSGFSRFVLQKVYLVWRAWRNYAGTLVLSVFAYYPGYAPFFANPAGEDSLLRLWALFTYLWRGVSGPPGTGFVMA